MKKYLLPFSIALVLAACGTETKKETTTEPVKQEEETHAKIDGTMSLNEGKKWKANDYTTVGVGNMAKHLVAFSDSASSDTLGLQKALENEFSLIFENCTMKGPAHDQLHNFLFPMVDMMEKLAIEAEQKEAFAKLEKHLATYSNYFE